MMIRLYQVDAFTSEKFKGNPAAICPLDSWLEDDHMQNIAAEINLSETAFYVPFDDGFELRWFTPLKEVRLCGHATLATAHVLFEHEGYTRDQIRFITRQAGELLVRRTENGYAMDFPADTPKELVDEDFASISGVSVQDLIEGTDDVMVVTDTEDAVRNAQPDLQALLKKDSRALIITAEGKHKDFVSRVFVPSCGIDEDPVTGSAHTLLTPYWSKKLDKTQLSARQVSSRGGDLVCRLNNDRVLLEGQAITVIQGQIL